MKKIFIWGLAFLMNGLIQVRADVTISADGQVVTQSGDITIGTGTTFTNNGSYSIGATSPATLNNFGTVITSGNFYEGPAGTINDFGSFLEIGGTTDTEGTFNIGGGDYSGNPFGDFFYIGDGTPANASTLEVQAGSLTVDNTTWLVVTPGSVLQIDSTASVIISGVGAGITPGGSILNDGTLDISQTTSQSLGDLSGTSASAILFLGANAVTIGGDNTSTTYAGVISDGGLGGGMGGSLIKDGAGTFTLTNANTYTGGTTINNGTLVLDASTGSLASGSNLTFGGSGQFTYDNANSSSTAKQQSLGSLNFNAGEGTVTSVLGGAQSSTLIFTSVTSAMGATGNFVVNDGVNGSTNKIVISGQAAGAMGSQFFFNGDNYAAYDAAGYVRGIEYGVDADSISSAGGSSISGSLTSASNVLLTGNITSQNSSTINTLNMGAHNLTLGDGQTLSVNSILVSGGSDTISGGSGITSSGPELVVRTDLASDSLTVSTDINAENLTKSGAGTLVIDGAFNGNTYNDEGTIQIGASTLLSGAVVNNANFDISQSQNQTIGSLAGSTSSATVDLGSNNLTAGGDNTSTTYAGTINGTGGLTKAGTGVLTLTNANTYSGGTTINGGTLALVGYSASLNANGAVVNNGDLDFSQSNNQTIGSLAGTATTATVDMSFYNLTTGGNNTSTTYAGVINGAASTLFKTGTGTFTLTNANTYTGGTIISAGTLALAGNNASLDATGSVMNNADFDISQSTNQTIGDLSGSVTTATVELGAYTLTTGGDNFGTTYEGTITGTGSLIKEGAGAFTLTNANTYIGGTVINAGTLALSGSGASLDASGSVIDNADFDISQSTNQTIGDLSSTVTTSTVDLGAYNLTTGGDGSGTTYEGTINGAGGLIKDGSGAFTLTNANTYTGGTTINNGALVLDASTGSLASGSNLTFGGTGQFVYDNTNSSSTAKQQSLGSLNFNAGEGTVTSILGGAQSSTLVFSSVTNSMGATGNFVVNDGVNGSTNKIVISGQAAGAMGSAFFFNGDDYAVYDAAGYVRGMDYGVDANSISSAGGSSISGSLTSASNVLLTGNIASQSSAAIDTLNMGANNLTLGDGQTLSVNSILVSGGSDTISGGNGITSGGSELVVRTDLASDSLTVSTDINGAGGLVKVGAGLLTLTNTNTYSGGTILNGGILQVASESNLGGAGAGGLTFGGGELLVTSTSTFTEGITLNGGNNTLATPAGSTTTYAGLISGTGSLTIGDGTNGGAIAITNANTYSGGTTLLSGTVIIGNNNALGTGTLTTMDPTVVYRNGINMANPINLQGDTTLEVDGAAGASQTGSITESGGTYSLTKVGAGALTLTSANTFSGGTSINAGTVVVGNASALGTGNVALNSGTLATSKDGTGIQINIGGNFTQAAGTTLLLNLYSSSNYDTLHLTDGGGVATVGGTLVLNPVGFAPGTGQTFSNFITGSNPVEGQFNSVMSSLPSIGTVSGTSIELYQKPFVGLLGSALTPNQKSVAIYIDGHDLTSTNPGFNSLVGGLNNASADSQALASSFNQLTPLNFVNFANTAMINNASFSTQALDNYLANHRSSDGTFVGSAGGIDYSSLAINSPQVDPVLQSVTSRLLAWSPPPRTGFLSDSSNSALGGVDKEDVKGSVNPGSTDLWNVFVSGNVILAQGFSDTAAGISGGNSTTGAVQFGADYKITKHLLVGATFGYGHTSATLDYLGSNATVNTYSPGVYLSYSNNGWYSNALSSYGFTNYNQNRKIAIGGFDGTSSSSPGGDQIVADLDGGYDFHKGNWTFGPTLGVQYVHLKVNGYSETGLPGADLTVNQNTDDSLRSLFGGRINYTLKSGSLLFMPHLSASWQHEYLNQSEGITSQFNSIGSGSFVVNTPNSSRNSALVDVGLDVQINDALTGFVDYSAQAGQSNYFGQSVQAGFKIGF